MTTRNLVIRILHEVLALDGNPNEYSEETELLGSMPQFDSMAVVTILTRLEEELDIIVDDDEIDAEVFESIGSFIAYVEMKLVS